MGGAPRHTVLKLNSKIKFQLWQLWACKYKNTISVGTVITATLHNVGGRFFQLQLFSVVSLLCNYAHIFKMSLQKWIHPFFLTVFYFKIHLKQWNSTVNYHTAPQPCSNLNTEVCSHSVHNRYPTALFKYMSCCYGYLKWQLTVLPWVGHGCNRHYIN